MNERIKQLAEQAGINKDAFQFSGTPIKHIVDEPSLKKFAELLVKECANFVENIFDDDGGHATCQDYAKGIRKYFGVNE